MTKLSFTKIISMTSAVILLFPFAGSAQQTSQGDVSAALGQQNVPAKAQDAEDSVERAVKRFRVGVFAGVGLDPQVIDFGGHATFGPTSTATFSFAQGSSSALAK